MRSYPVTDARPLKKTQGLSTFGLVKPRENHLQITKVVGLFTRAAAYPGNRGNIPPDISGRTSDDGPAQRG